MRSFSICRPCLRSLLRQRSQCQRPSQSTSGPRTRTFHSARATWAKDDETSQFPEDPAATSKSKRWTRPRYGQEPVDHEIANLLRGYESSSHKGPNRTKRSDIRNDQSNVERSTWTLPPKDAATVPDSAEPSTVRYNQENIEREMVSLLEKFGLAEIEDKSPTDHGVKITKDNRIIIKNISDSKVRHKTALVLSPAPASLSMRDFRKLLKTGKHIEGLKSGGLEDVIPMRRFQDMRPLGEWILIFSTPWDAYVFQRRADMLRNLARKSMPTSPTSGIQPPGDLSSPELEGFTIRDYTLGTPWQPANLFAHLHPFPQRIQRAISLHKNITSSSQKASQAFPVRVWVDEKHKLALEAEVVKHILSRDEQLRGAPWDVVDSDDAIVRITGDLRHEILDEGNLPHANLGPQPSDSIRILFKTESEARRFVRVWHRTPIPNYVALNMHEAETVLKAECLFYTDGY